MTRPKRKSTNDIFPIECVFCEEGENDLSKLSKKTTTEKLHATGELYTSFKNSNVEHVKKLIEKWIEMASALNDINVLCKIDGDLRAREILYHGKCLNRFQNRYNALKVRDEGVSKVRFKRAVVLERAIAFLRETAYKRSDNPVEVRLVLEAYNSYLKEEGFTDNFNHITRFAELVLSHTKEFEIHKNEHNVNVFILKDYYVKSTASFSSFDVSMKFLNDMRKIVTPLRKAVDDVSLEFNKNFDQANSLPNELISLVGSLVENNPSASNPSQSILTIAGLIAYNYKKRTHKPEETQQNVASHQLAARETPIASYVSLKLYSCIRSKNILQKLHFVGICSSYNRVIQILSDWASLYFYTLLKTYKVIPLKLQERVFTVFTKDNVDKNRIKEQNIFMVLVFALFNYQNYF